MNGKKNGNGKEYYYKDQLKFEGEYLNGERNGKGKEYYENGNLFFEGEYLKGKRWNGKGYNNNGKFEYELKNGCGKVKVYDYDGQLEFEGEYLNGKKYKGRLFEYDSDSDGDDYYSFTDLEFKNGYPQIKLYINDKLIKEINLNSTPEKDFFFSKNGIKIKEGKIKQYNKDGNLLVEEEYLNGKRWNEKCYNNDGEFEFELKNGCGKVKEYLLGDNKLIFEG